ncbi:hypothetical protein [Candidatus Mycoplasma haematobovis]|nr:hypothetical protein [Candidatus Mycoplasma haematobovis]
MSHIKHKDASGFTIVNPKERYQLSYDTLNQLRRDKYVKTPMS